MKLTINYGPDAITKNFDGSRSISQVLSDSSIKAVLGYGDNVKALVSGVEMSNDTVLSSDTEITIETRANSKASDIRVTVAYGPDEITKTFSEGTTIDEIIGDANVKALLGYGDNVKALVLGSEQDGDTILASGARITIETRANQKA
jgi:hypothetical protein